MPLANSTVTGNGVTTVFTVPFAYLLKAHISFTVNGVVTAFTWLTSSTVNITPAPANGTSVKCQRTTPKSPLVNFADGNSMFEDPLDALAAQILYITQEQQDQLDALVLGGASSLAGTSVSIAPAGGISAINAQSALYELDAEKVPISGTWAGQITAPVGTVPYSFAGDLDTGLGRPAPGQMSLVVDGVSTVLVHTGGAVVTGSIELLGPGNQLIFQERDGTDSFVTYADAGGWRLYSPLAVADILIVDHSGNLTATGAIREGANRVFSKTSRTRFGPFAPVTNGKVATAHGLGVIPTRVEVILKCTTADRGYAVNQEIVYFPHEYSGVCTTSLMKDNNNVSLAINGTIALTQETGSGGGGAIVNGSWDIYFDIWA